MRERAKRAACSRCQALLSWRSTTAHPALRSSFIAPSIAPNIWEADREYQLKRGIDKAAELIPTMRNMPVGPMLPIAP